MKKLVRKKTILDFNHIDPSISPAVVEEIQKLYATYKNYGGVSRKFTKNKNSLIWLKKSVPQFWSLEEFWQEEQL